MKEPKFEFMVSVYDSEVGWYYMAAETIEEARRSAKEISGNPTAERILIYKSEFIETVKDYDFLTKNDE